MLLVLVFLLTLMRVIGYTVLAAAHAHDSIIMICYAIMVVSEVGHMAILIWLMRATPPKGGRTDAEVPIAEL
jgi:hypothetical protein